MTNDFFLFLSTRHKTQRQIKPTKVFFFLFIILLLLQSPLFFLFCFFFFVFFFLPFQFKLCWFQNHKAERIHPGPGSPGPPNTHNVTPLPHKHDSYHQVPGLTALQVLAKSYFPVLFFSVLKIFSFSWEAKEASRRQGEFTRLRCSGRPLLSDWGVSPVRDGKKRSELVTGAQEKSSCQICTVSKRGDWSTSHKLQEDVPRPRRCREPALSSAELEQLVLLGEHDAESPQTHTLSHTCGKTERLY